MKRGSNIMYVCTSTPTKTNFQRRPNFKFSDSCLPKLVDYSFSDDSDSGNDSPCSLDESWDQLQMSLDSLTASFGSLETSRTPLSTGFNRHLHERASLRLKAEQDKERVRNMKVLKHLNESIGTSKTKISVRKQLRGIFSSSKASLQEGSSSTGMRRQVKSLPALALSKSELDSSVRVCEAGRPTKRRKVDLGVFSRFSAKRFSFKSKSKKVSQEQEEVDTPKRNCLFSCFKKSASYPVNQQ